MTSAGCVGRSAVTMFGSRQRCVEVGRAGRTTVRSGLGHVDVSRRPDGRCGTEHRHGPSTILRIRRRHIVASRC